MPRAKSKKWMGWTGPPPVRPRPTSPMAPSLRLAWAMGSVVGELPRPPDRRSRGSVYIVLMGSLDTWAMDLWAMDLYYQPVLACANGSYGPCQCGTYITTHPPTNQPLAPSPLYHWPRGPLDHCTYPNHAPCAPTGTPNPSISGLSPSLSMLTLKGIMLQWAHAQGYNASTSPEPVLRRPAPCPWQTRATSIPCPLGGHVRSPWA